MLVLVVDDDELSRQALRRALRAYHSVSTAGSIAEALQQIESAEPDVLLCDYELDGELATELLRAVGETHPRVRRILYSGMMPERLRSFVTDGLAERALGKPAVIDEILAAIGD
jgi:DNA-binding NtrC family response regulator